MRNVHSTAWRELLDTTTGADGDSSGAKALATASPTICSINGSTESLSGIAAGLTLFAGRLAIRQQELSREGACEICVVGVCRDCIIMGQSSPPQWPDLVSFGLQFARASSGAAKSVAPRMRATSLKDLLMFSPTIVWGV